MNSRHPGSSKMTSTTQPSSSSSLRIRTRRIDLLIASISIVPAAPASHVSALSLGRSTAPSAARSSSLSSSRGRGKVQPRWVAGMEMYATSVAVSVDEVPNSAFPPRVYNYAVSIAIPPTNSPPPLAAGTSTPHEGKGGWKTMIRMTRESAQDTDHLSPRQSHPFSSKFNVR